MYCKTFFVSAIVRNPFVRRELEGIFHKRLAEMSDEEMVIGVACLAALGRIW